MAAGIPTLLGRGQRFETGGGGIFRRHKKIAAMAIRMQARV